MKNKKSLESQIHVIISNMLIYDLNDSFFANITINSVQLQSGNSEAIIYFSSLKNRDKSIDKMEQISSKINQKVSQGLTIYKAPKLIFRYDDQLEQINKIESLLDSVKKDTEKEN